MDEKTILVDLRRQFGKRTLLTDEEIAPLLRMSPKTQANRRSMGTFPIPVTKIGTRPLVSIYALAAFLARTAGEASSETQEGPRTLAEKNGAGKRRKASRKTKQASEAATEPLNRPPLGPQILADLGFGDLPAP